jgi:oligoendopeptidase F
MDHMLEKYTDDDIRLFLLGQRLDGYRQTLFRQTLFAEFEMRIHEMGEAGEPLTGDSITKLYLDLLRKYYGHDLGVCGVEELYGIEWAYIPHFYSYDFYVYQYATSLTGSTAIAEIIRNEAAMTPPVSKTRDAYLGMLGAGCSKYPIDLLKDVGIDMTTSAPFDAAMREMNQIMDEMEEILGK